LCFRWGFCWGKKNGVVEKTPPQMPQNQVLHRRACAPTPKKPNEYTPNKKENQQGPQAAPQTPKTTATTTQQKFLSKKPLQNRKKAKAGLKGKVNGPPA